MVMVMVMVMVIQAILAEALAESVALQVAFATSFRLCTLADMVLQSKRNYIRQLVLEGRTVHISTSAAHQD
eukprot:3357438-Karenia_brevis.AAC.1